MHGHAFANAKTIDKYNCWELKAVGMTKPVLLTSRAADAETIELVYVLQFASGHYFKLIFSSTRTSESQQF